jgi:hypothetical protein
MIQIIVFIAALACCAAPAAAERTVYSLDFNWKFLLNPDVCINGSNATFPKDLSNMQCNGLSQQPAATAPDCAAACCSSDACQVWQFCPGGDAGCGSLSCWTGRVNQCSPVKGWQSHARDSVPPPPSHCDVECAHQPFILISISPFLLLLNCHALCRVTFSTGTVSPLSTTPSGALSMCRTILLLRDHSQKPQTKRTVTFPSASAGTGSTWTCPRTTQTLCMS